jgi:transcription termination/antitermination protein NusA
VRLAAKLTGWKIDIKSEEEKRREVEAQLGALEIGAPSQDAGEEPEEPAGGETAVDEAADTDAPEIAAAAAAAADVAAASETDVEIGNEQPEEAAQPAASDEMKTEN